MEDVKIVFQKLGCGSESFWATYDNNFSKARIQ